MITKLKWDYLGWKQHTSSPYQQKDWIQTLITRINECGTNIYQATLVGAGNTVIINKTLLPLLEELEYFNEIGANEYVIGSRYSILIDDSKPTDVITVFRKSPKTEKLAEFTETYFGENLIPVISVLYAIVDSTQYKENLSNPNMKLITDEMLTREIKILNYHEQ